MIFNLVLTSRSENRFSEGEYQEASGEDFASPYAHIPEEAITAQDIPF